MDAERTLPAAGNSLAHQAQSLIGALAGVAHAHVAAGPRGIDAIDIVATDHQSARQMAARVRSALLAGMATPVLPARIHVRVMNDDGGRGRNAAASPNGHHSIGHRVSRVERPAGPDYEPRPRPAARAALRTEPVEREARRDDHHDEPRPILSRPRLVAVDTERTDDGRVRCRVSIAFATRVHSAEAVAIDLPGAPAQTAAQATVRALAEAGIHGLELNGLREVEIAGREYLVVALRRTDTSRRHRSGSAPVIGSAERSAAEATVVAANELF